MKILRSGKKLMQEISPNSDFAQVKLAILKTMAFFSLYELPLNLHTIHQLLYQKRATFEEVRDALGQLVGSGKIVAHDGLYALKSWSDGRLSENKTEIQKRWRKVDRYFWILSIIPFIDHISIINSLAFGNAHQESDIDFFVVTKERRLYFVRSIIIVIFRLLRVYKTRGHINERFCFGFYVTHDHPALGNVLIEGEDPLFAFWFASFAPILNRKSYQHLVEANRWIYGYFPNLEYITRLTYIKEPNSILRFTKRFLEIVLTIPAIILEPLLRSIHIRHTFNLPENHWQTSTTVANQHMLKLHALDPRKDVRAKFNEILRNF
jgi:hypothetical protein